MREFMDESFLLENDVAIMLYNKYAKNMPIYDYHCHLNPKEIAENKRYKNITELWLGGDHYKWRQMRSWGVDESYITGDKPDLDKFIKWAEVVSNAIGNPLYHWSHNELRIYFGIYTPLNTKTATEIFTKVNEMLKKPEFYAQNLIMKSNVHAVNTTDDPLDSLEWHIQIAKLQQTNQLFTTKVWPAFRPDKAVNINKETFLPWLDNFENIAGKLSSFSEFCDALRSRINHFHINGCRLADHALDPVVYVDCSLSDAETVYKKAKEGTPLTNLETQQFQSQLMLFFANEYTKHGWVMQLHLGVNRNINQRMYKKLGADTGFDAIGDEVFSKNLASLLNALDLQNKLPKTILYSLNPRENMVLATTMGAFQDGMGKNVKGKIQMGSAWWFNDTKLGMRQQLEDLANEGMLATFVGMLTDSRSFISYPRHDYFRRILCNLLGEWLENGEIINDEELIGNIIKDICFNNIWNYVENDK